MSWLDRFTLNRKILSDVQARSWEIREIAIGIRRRVQNLEIIMAGTDRELYAAVIAGLNALGPAIDGLAADRDSWKSVALAAEGREASDEAEDTAAAQPVKDLVDALLQKVTPAAPDVAEQQPASPQDATEVVNAAPDPAPSDGGDTPTDAA